MEFNNKLYELRKQKGLSQEELAHRLNVSRQTISKWEIGDSAPDMEKLVALSDLFEISLNELVLGKVPNKKGDISDENITSQKHLNISSVLDEKVLTQNNKKGMKFFLKYILIIFGVFVAVDIISMLVYFIVYGVPK